MIVRTIVLRGEPVLYRKSAQVTHGKDLAALIGDMRRLMKKHDGIGIAAPQIGEGVELFLIARDLFPKEVQEKLPSDVFINPKVLKKSFKHVSMEEGCLSVPGVFGEVDRRVAITVEALDEKGRKFKVSAKELLARVLQHEIDHLKGTLFVDKAKQESLHEIFSDGTIKPWNL